jgi:hypothetical protein
MITGKNDKKIGPGFASGPFFVGIYRSRVGIEILSV